MTAEYGSTSPSSANDSRFGESGDRRQRVMYGLCAASMLLVVVAVTGDKGSSGVMSLAEKLQALSIVQTGNHKGVASISHWPGDTQIVAPVQREARASPLKGSSTPTVAEATTLERPADSKESEPMSVVTAAAKAEALAAPERRSSNSSQLLAKPVGKPFAVGQKQLALARSATPTAGTVQHMLAANMTATGGGKGNSTDSGVASDDQDTSSQESTDGDQFTSPLGNLEPTGIMSVFFNTKIMLTALAVIGSLLILICCFARNADCALS